MAKDAKGHGSDARGGNATTQDPQARRNAYEKMLRQTLTMHPAMLGVMGGPSKEEAASRLRSMYGYSDSDVAKLVAGHPGIVSDADAAKAH